MTTYDLNDVVRLRLEEISFFLFLLLASGVVIRLLWNVLARGIPTLPRLPYRQALALTMILSLGMLLVLSMISGARELLTPEAWQKQGNAYKLGGTINEEKRLQNITALKTALFERAASQSGLFPPHDWTQDIPSRLWEADNAGTHFVYFGGLNTNSGDALIAVEPASFGNIRYGITASGAIRKFSAAEIAQAKPKAGLQ